ncbi:MULTISPECIES: AAA family ATPase [Bacillus]|uniref:AAA family ATPase n=1 Tax=Bacillus TaxID=1386 RepID=UPI0030FB3DEF
MIKEFEIHNFRQYKKVYFKDLGKINLFLGNNNTGKTSILEAIAAFSYGENVNNLIVDSLLRSKELYSAYDFMERIMSSFNNQNEKPFNFSFKATLEDNKTHTIQHQLDPGPIFADFKPNLLKSFGDSSIRLSKDTSENLIRKNSTIGNWTVIHNEEEKNLGFLDFPPSNENLRAPNLLNTRFVDILTHREVEENLKIYSFLKREGIMSDFVKELSRTFTDILDIDSIPYPDGTPSPVSFKSHTRGLLPMYNFGDGMQRWYNILGGLILIQNAIHCIEEVDSTFHPNSQKELAKNLVKYANKYNNQLFMTSHSIEFVDNLLESLYGEDSDMENDEVRVITLKYDEKTGTVKSRVLTGKEAFESRENYQLELR